MFRISAQRWSLSNLPLQSCKNQWQHNPKSPLLWHGQWDPGWLPLKILRLNLTPKYISFIRIVRKSSPWWRKFFRPSRVHLLLLQYLQHLPSLTLRQMLRGRMLLKALKLKNKKLDSPLTLRGSMSLKPLLSLKFHHKRNQSPPLLGRTEEKVLLPPLNLKLYSSLPQP